MLKPLVSICIPVYNTVNYIEETINCFLNQTYKNIEIIITDDCSNDGTWELLLAKYSKNSILRLFKNDINLGIGDNWNVCYEKCLGDYVIIANADDLYNINFVQKAIDMFQSNEKIEYIVCAYDIISNNKEIIEIPKFFIETPKGMLTKQFEIDFFINPFLNQFSIGKKIVFDKNRCIDGRLFLPTQVCDFELRLRLAKSNTQTYFLSEILGSYRRHNNNASSKRYGELKSYYSIINNYHFYLKENYYLKYLVYRFKLFKILLKDLVKKPIGFEFKLLFLSFKHLIR